MAFYRFCGWLPHRKFGCRSCLFGNLGSKCDSLSYDTAEAILWGPRHVLCREPSNFLAHYCVIVFHTLHFAWNRVLHEHSIVQRKYPTTELSEMSGVIQTSLESDGSLMSRHWEPFISFLPLSSWVLESASALISISSSDQILFHQDDRLVYALLTLIFNQALLTYSKNSQGHLTPSRTSFYFSTVFLHKDNQKSK